MVSHFWSAPLALLTIIAFSSQANAGVCNYRLSDLVRSGSSATDKSIAVAEGTVAAAGAAGLAFKAAGFYTIVNGITGAAMIGSTAAGTSAAGTMGILAGTSGALGTAGAIVSNPVTIAAAVVTVISASALEAGCYFTDERITDKDEVLAILKEVAKGQDAKYFKLEPVTLFSYWSGPYNSTALFLWNEKDQQMDMFPIENLYIVNGVLMNSDWGLNTELGEIGAIALP